MLRPIDAEVFDILAKADRFWTAAENVLKLELSATASLVLLSLIVPDSARFLAFYHAVMDAFLLLYLFASYFSLVKYAEEHEMRDWLREPPLSYAPFLIATVPLALFIGNWFLAFGGAPSNEWLGLLAGYNAVMLGAVAVAYLVFYKLDLE